MDFTSDLSDPPKYEWWIRMKPIKQENKNDENKNEEEVKVNDSNDSNVKITPDLITNIPNTIIFITKNKNIVKKLQIKKYILIPKNEIYFLIFQSKNISKIKKSAKKFNLKFIWEGNILENENSIFKSITENFYQL